MITLQIALEDKTVSALRKLANKQGLTVERFLSERLDQVVNETSSHNIDAAFRKIVDESIGANRGLLRKLAE